jgi:hypothetical protein
MVSRAGRPPKQTKFEKSTLTAARTALLDAARELKLPLVRYPIPTRRDPDRTVLQPRHLDLAVLALELGQAIAWIAGEHVAQARDLDGVTWEDVGEAFGMTSQSAHHRFRDQS